MMNRNDITALADMARIALTDTELAALENEFAAILDYVGQIDTVVATGALTKKVGPVYNVFRADEAVSAGEAEVQALHDAMPERDGRFLQVKKIL